MAIENFDQCRLHSEKKFQEIGLDIQKIKDEMEVFTARLDKQAKMVEDIQSLSQSVALLASNMDAMLKEQKAQNSRIQTLEQKPIKRFDSVLDTIIKLVLTAAMGVLLVKIGLQ
jgi:Skp family chaperone for outer membrane proteins